MKTLLLTLLIANALFWGLCTNTADCLLIDNLNKMFQTKIACPEHKVHLMMGVGFYLASVYYSQKGSKEFKVLMS